MMYLNGKRTNYGANDYQHEFDVICYVFLLQKNLDFKLKVVGGDITAVPGISDAIEVREISIL